VGGAIALLLVVARLPKDDYFAEYVLFLPAGGGVCFVVALVTFLRGRYTPDVL
jgi:hypothetical protein